MDGKVWGKFCGGERRERPGDMGRGEARYGGRGGEWRLDSEREGG